jgi:hypothetical protein
MSGKEEALSTGRAGGWNCGGVGDALGRESTREAMEFKVISP